MSRPGFIVCLWGLAILSLAAPLALMAAKPPQLPLEFNDKVGEPGNQVAAGTEPEECEIVVEPPSVEARRYSEERLKELMRAEAAKNAEGVCAAKCPRKCDCHESPCCVCQATCPGCEEGCCEKGCCEKGCCEKGCCEKGCCEKGCCEPKSELTCPHLKRQNSACASKPNVEGPTDVMSNLKKLVEADRMMRQAEDFQKAGRLAEAIECLEWARKMVPGSPLASRAETRLAVLRKPADAEASTEEAETKDTDEDDLECPEDQSQLMNVPLMSILQPMLPPLDPALTEWLDHMLIETGIDPR